MVDKDKEYLVRQRATEGMRHLALSAKPLNLTPQPVKTVQNSERLSPLEESYSAGPMPDVGPSYIRRALSMLDGEREPDIGGYDE